MSQVPLSREKKEDADMYSKVDKPKSNKSVIIQGLESHLVILHLPETHHQQKMIEVTITERGERRRRENIKGLLLGVI